MTLGTAVEINLAIKDYDQLMDYAIDEHTRIELHLRDNPMDLGALELMSKILDDILYYHKMIFLLSRMRRTVYQRSDVVLRISDLGGEPSRSE